MRRFLLVGAALAAFCSVPGCGGNVVVDGPGGAGGQGGQGGSPTTTPPGTTTPSGTFTNSTTTTVPFNPQAYCKNACDVLSTYGCTPGDTCAADCASAFDSTPSACQDEFIAYVDCFIELLPQSDCDLAPQCEGLYSTYSDCISPPGDCANFDCEGGGESCYCGAYCQGQYREVECKAAEEGFVCNCYVEGDVVGTCGEFGDACDIEAGCCTEYF